MLGISDEYIIEHHHGDTYDRNDEEGVRLYYNQTDPLVLRDGVDGIIVAEEDEDYRVTYWGYVAGKMRVRREGVTELGREFLTNRDDPPRWLVDSDSLLTDDLPWWIPEDTDLDPQSQCQRCERQVPAESIITSSRSGDSATEERFCEECWDELSTEDGV